MPPDDEDQKPKPVYAPTEQALLPGYKKYVSAPPKDYRQWKGPDGHPIDSPKFKGPMFGGKVIPPLVDRSGRPIRLGDFQVVRDLRSSFKVIDWSRPAFGGDRQGEDDGNESASLGTSPIMGKEVYKSKNIQRSINAMIALHREKRDRLAGLAPDPAFQNDLKGKPIQIGALALGRWMRGPIKGTFTIVDTGREITHSRRFSDLPKCKTLKHATNMLILESRKRKTAPVKKTRAVGAPIAFDVPTGFGGGGGGGGFGGGFQPWAEREYPEPGSPSWKSSVQLFARAGEWCTTAKLIWADQRPERLEREAAEAREAYLREREDEMRRESEATDDSVALADFEKLSEEEKILMNELLERFDARLVSIKLPEKRNA